MKRKTKESRAEKIARYMKLDKKSLVILLVDTQYCNEAIIKKLSR